MANRGTWLPVRSACHLRPLFSWKALGWALLYFWFFSTLLQAIIYISGYSG
ncbi:hypothetical protein ACVWCN_23410, partial [Escherichia coli]